MCMTIYGLSGTNCDQWCQQAYMIFAINTVIICLALCTCFVSVYLLYRVFKRSHLGFTSVVATLSLTGLSSWFFVCSACLGLVTTVGFADFYVVVIGTNTGRQLRRIPPSMEYATKVLYSLAYCFSTSTMVILPLTWVSEIILTLQNSENSITDNFLNKRSM